MDDTLIQTTKTLTPHLFRGAIKELIAHGLPSPPLEEALMQLMQINALATSSKEALQTWISNLGGGEEERLIALKALHGKEGVLPFLQASAHAEDVLSVLKKRAALAIVTFGEEAWQRAKLRSSGIDSALFSKIITSAFPNKEPLYQEILQEFDLAPQDVVVVGDRIAVDLEPAKRLGCFTVQMRQGRGERERGGAGVVDATIYSLDELVPIINTMSKEVTQV